MGCYRNSMGFHRIFMRCHRNSMGLFSIVGLILCKPSLHSHIKPFKILPNPFATVRDPIQTFENSKQTLSKPM